MTFPGIHRLQDVLCNALAQIDIGNFNVSFWDGSVYHFGQGTDFTIHFKNKESLRKLILDLPLGFGEGYMNGDITVQGDLMQVINTGLQAEQLQKTTLKSLFNAIKLQILQKNSKTGDERHIAHHYDLGNDFYRLWLDPKMVYSCAYFENDGDTLEQAQIQKCALCCRKLRLQANERLLDIGCGWGSLLIYAAKKFGVHGVGITLSQEQLDYGREQIEKEGVQKYVHLERLDYRDLPQMQQTFHKIVSVGMFEHVGKANMGLFLENARRVLKANGLLLLHTIGKTIDEPTNSWIKKFIFPGGYLPDLGSILKYSTKLGFNFIDCENLRTHYSRTLDIWSQRFIENEKQIRAMFDERFIRMWQFYLAGCSAEFARGSIHVFQLLFSSGVRNDLPLTRRWMSDNCPDNNTYSPCSNELLKN